MTLICPFVDDTMSEANAIADALRAYGFPLEVQPMMPGKGPTDTLELLVAAKPTAAIVDYKLEARPGFDTDELAARLIKKGIPTAMLTKDRDVADEGYRKVGKLRIPVFNKRAFIRDGSVVNSLSASLNLTRKLPTGDIIDLEERLFALQDASLVRKLSAQERQELQLLIARVQISEQEELGKIEEAEATGKLKFESIIAEIRGIRRALEDESRPK